MSAPPPDIHIIISEETDYRLRLLKDIYGGSLSGIANSFIEAGLDKQFQELNASETFRQEVVLAYAQAGRRKPLSCALRASYTIHPRNAGRCDIDNREKALFDALQCAGVFLDDNQITDVDKRKREPRPPKGAC